MIAINLCHGVVEEGILDGPTSHTRKEFLCEGQLEAVRRDRELLLRTNAARCGAIPDPGEAAAEH